MPEVISPSSPNNYLNIIVGQQHPSQCCPPPPAAASSVGGCSYRASWPLRECGGLSNWMNHLGVFCTWTTIFIYNWWYDTTFRHTRSKRGFKKLHVYDWCTTDNYARIKARDCEKRFEDYSLVYILLSQKHYIAAHKLEDFLTSSFKTRKKDNITEFFHNNYS